MMKKLLCMVALLAGAVSFAQFPSIGILGSSTPAGWDTDLDMQTTDGVVYTYNNLVINVPASDAGVKFRQDDAWTNNWGGSGFPSGTASPGGQNIPAVNGTYNVTFNLNTLQYSFVATGFNTVTLMGDGVNVNLFTTDGITYTANNVSLPGTPVTFYINNVVVPAAADLQIDANSYNVTFNAQTGAYTFNYVTISMIGAGVINWDTDVDMQTEDGVNYTLNNFTFAGGEAKFRLNHEWGQAWGGTEFPAGTGDSNPGAPNLNIIAGDYDVTFNRESGEFNFAAVTNGIAGFEKSNIAVYPNPAESVWNLKAASAIQSITISDVTGKIVSIYTVNGTEATVNASGLAAGMYFAQVTSGEGVQNIKLIKK